MDNSSLAQLGSARVMFEALGVLETQLGREIPMSHIRAFLRIAMAGAEGIDQGQLQRMLGVSSAGMSRIVRGLSRINYDRSEGRDLVAFDFDPRDNRRRLIRLNDKGAALVQSLMVRLNSIQAAHAA